MSETITITVPSEIYDEDNLMLLKRVNEKYPHKVVFLKKVRILPAPVLHFRSPRLTRRPPS